MLKHNKNTHHHHHHHKDSHLSPKDVDAVKHGSCLEHGEAHEQAHQNWNRRQFLTTTGVATLGGLLLGNTPVTAFTPNPFIQALNSANSDRVLVLLRLDGGNDGLNTIIPHSEDVGRSKYIEYRQNSGLVLGMGSGYNNNTLLSGYGNVDYAVSDQMLPIMNMWNTGNMAVVNSVGYPNQNLSHFLSTDIWVSAADHSTDYRLKSGWLGRYLDTNYPTFFDTPPSVPVALQIGYNSNLLFRSPSGNAMELVFRNVSEFYRIAQSGQLYNTDGFSTCPQGTERVFLRQVANQSFRYSQAINEAYSCTTTNATYPNPITDLAEQLSIVARLIKGNLGTKIYMVSISEFDTHANQNPLHLTLWQRISEAISAFYDDLTATGHQEKVALMTFSEFGRTIKGNGSAGTDHGTMAPVLLFGEGITGGLHGSPINLFDPVLDPSQTTYPDERVYFESTYQNPTDFRSLYATLLQDWLCVDSGMVDYVLGDSFARMNGLVANPCTPTVGSNNVAILLGHNPSRILPTSMEIKFAIRTAGVARLRLMNTAGQPLVTFFNEFRKAGSYTQLLNRNNYRLPPGEYIYQLDVAGQTYHRRLRLE